MRTPASVQSSGGKLLEAHIRGLGKSIPAWCDDVGLADKRIQIQRLINGERCKRVTVNLAFAIEDATEGDVPAESFRTDRKPRRKAA